MTARKPVSAESILIPVGLDAILYTDPDTTMIARGRNLQLLVQPEGSI